MYVYKSMIMFNLGDLWELVNYSDFKVFKLFNFMFKIYLYFNENDFFKFIEK